MVLATQWALAPRAWAGHEVTLRVTIERVEQKGCTDFGSGSDFYSRIVIGDRVSPRFGPIDGEDEIAPTDWIYSTGLSVDDASPVPVEIRLAEDDGFLNFETDRCDIAPNDGFGLNLSVPLVPCSVTGDASGSCGTSITVRGNGDGDDGDAQITFRIDVFPVGSDAPGLAVRCTHTPLWPQPGDTVTITVESFAGNLQVGDTLPDPRNPGLADRRKIADKLEIWVQNGTGPAPDAPDLVLTNKSVGSFVVTNVPAGDLEYGCVARKGTDNRFTGWRRTRVGPPAEGAAVPVILTGDRAHSVDIVFIADLDNYPAVNNAAFLTDVTNVIKGAYYGQNYFLDHQHQINFWLADQRGDADPGGAPGPICVLTRPANWATDYGWADAGAILHTDAFRDCANMPLFSSGPTLLSTVLHETGHAVFALPDEYCRESGNRCDGGYWENPEKPSLYDTNAECVADAPDLGRTAAQCRSFTTAQTPPMTWFLSEPTPNDLMNVDQRPPQAADIRRMDWVFNNCAAGMC
jgi:hypothetical protein